MGLIDRWRTSRRRKRAATTLTKLVDGALKGKAMDDLEREGGWDVLALNWRDASDVFEDYTTYQMEQIMSISSIVYACVRKICVSAPEANLEIGRWDGDSWEPNDEHPYLDLLRQPNEGQDWRMFLWSILSHLLLTGMSYVWKTRNVGGEIIGLHPLPTSWVTPKYSSRDVLTHYEINFGAGKPQKVLPNDVFVMYYPDPSNPYSGIGPMQAALKDLQVDDRRASFMIEILANTHFASAVLHQKEWWTEEQMAEMRRALRDLIGPGKRGDPLFVSGENAKVDFPQAPSDIDWKGTANLSETRMCAAFGVSPILLGLRSGLERSIYASYREARTSFYVETMKPLWDWLASSFERGLFRSEEYESDEHWEVEADYEDVSELQEDLEKRHERVRADWEVGFYTLDEAMEALGRDAVGGDAGAMRVMRMNLVPVVLDGPAPEREHETPDDWEE